MKNPHPTQSRLSKRTGAVFLAQFLLLAFTHIAQAKNPDLSFWHQNISETIPFTASAAFDTSPEIAVSGKTVHAIWISTDANYGYRRLYYQRSIDNGRSWEGKKILLEATDYNDISNNRNLRRLAVFGDYIHIALRRNLGDGYYGITYIRSSDNGANFDAPRVIDKGPRYWGLSGSYISASENNVTVAYTESYNNHFDYSYTDVSVLLSTDSGSTFTEVNAFESENESGSAEPRHIIDMQHQGDHIAILYGRYQGFTGGAMDLLYVAASNDGGRFFSNATLHEYTDGIFSTQDEHYVPKIAIADETISVVWTAYDDDGARACHYARSFNGGLTWSFVESLTRGLFPPGYQSLAGQATVVASGDYVYVLAPAEVSGEVNIYLRASTNGGADFGPLRELTNSRWVTDTGWWPMLQLDPRDPTGGSVYAAWAAPSLVYSNDGGQSFSSPRVAFPAFSGSSIPIRPAIVAGKDGRVHFADESNFYSTDLCGGWCDGDIFYRGLDSLTPPSGSDNQALKLFSDNDLDRFDSMHVPASDWLDITDRLTLELWVRPAAGGVTTGSMAGKKPIAHKYGGIGAPAYDSSYALMTWDCWGCTEGDRQALARIITSDGAFDLAPGDTSVGIVPDGEWTHLAFSYDAKGGSNNFKLYMDGALIASTSATGELLTRDSLFFVGRYGHWSVDELRIWNAARTQTEITDNMSARLTGQETGLSAYYSFDGTTRDLTGHGNDGTLMYREEFVDGAPAVDPPDECITEALTLTKPVTYGSFRSRSETTITVAGTVAVAQDAELVIEAPKIHFEPGFMVTFSGRLQATAGAVHCGSDR